MLDSIDKDSVSTLNSTDKDAVSMTNDLKSDETGNSTPQSEMMMASFRIDRQLWVKFGAIAKRERLTATDVLTDYIQRCTDNDKTEYAVSIGNDASVSIGNYDTDKLNDAVMVAVSTLSLPDRDAVRTMISTAISTAEFHTREDVKRIDVLTMVSTDVSIELARIKSQLDVFKSEIEALKKSHAIG
jgi:hypothetical protein